MGKAFRLFSPGKRTGLFLGQYPGVQVHLIQGWASKTGTLYRDSFDLYLSSDCSEGPEQPAPSLGCQETAGMKPDSAATVIFYLLTLLFVSLGIASLILNNLKFCTQKLIKNPNYLLFKHGKICRISLKSFRK